MLNNVLRNNGDAWIEVHNVPNLETCENRDAYFIFGRVDDQNFIIDGPWDVYSGAEYYLQRLLRWKKVGSYITK